MALSWPEALYHGTENTPELVYRMPLIPSTALVGSALAQSLPTAPLFSPPSNWQNPHCHVAGMVVVEKILTSLRDMRRGGRWWPEGG